MLGSDLLYTALNIAAITDNLDTYLTGKALFSDMHLPKSYLGNNSINFYMATPFVPNMAYNDYVYSGSCRGLTYEESRGLANTVIEEINRTSYIDYYVVCTVQTTISPMDDTDTYNTQIEFTIKSR